MGKNVKQKLGMSLTPLAVGNTSLSFCRYLIGFCLAFLLAACSSTGRVVDHSFGFDTRRAVPAVEVLNYQYGDSAMTGTRPPKWALNDGKPFYFEGVTGPIHVADFLYVKWRIKETGEIFERNIDLRHRLPRDIKDHKVYFDIKGPLLFIYLISPERLPRGESNGLPIYWYYKMKTIYPDQPKN